MSSEKDMRKRIVRVLRELDAVSIENGAGVGTPDVNFVGGWLELKSVDDWPARKDTSLRIEHFTAQQRVWLAKRRRAGGAAFVLLKVENDWLLFDGMDAALVLGKRSQSELWDIAVASWPGGLDEEELLECLKKISAEERSCSSTVEEKD